MTTIRLQAFLARSGVAPSRRKAETLISTGRVRINGQPAHLGESVTLSDRVLLDGEPVSLPQTHAYLALNKPKGYLTTLKDERKRPTVADLMPKNLPGLVPIGRLDAGTTGLILLTNDGPLAHHVAHPSSEIEKEYQLILKPPEQNLDKRLASLARGPDLEDGKMLSPKINNLYKTSKDITLHLTIHEGRNRIIRRACAAVGLVLLSLERIRIGPVRLDALPEGQYRELSEKELNILKRSTGRRTRG